MDTLVNRLRGEYEIGPNGVFGKRDFSSFIPPICIEAAQEIERLTQKNEALQNRADELQRHTGWVSVDERNPTKLEEYLVWREHAGFGLSFYFPDKGTWHWPGVTHWMEIPQPPKAKEE